MRKEREKRKKKSVSVRVCMIRNISVCLFIIYIASSSAVQIPGFSNPCRRYVFGREAPEHPKVIVSPPSHGKRDESYNHDGLLRLVLI